MHDNLTFAHKVREEQQIVSVCCDERVHLTLGLVMAVCCLLFGLCVSDKQCVGQTSKSEKRVNETQRARTHKGKHRVRSQDTGVYAALTQRGSVKNSHLKLNIDVHITAVNIVEFISVHLPTGKL